VRRAKVAAHYAQLAGAGYVCASKPNTSSRAGSEAEHVSEILRSRSGSSNSNNNKWSK